jgi:Protein of unknown function (DUF2716)
VDNPVWEEIDCESVWTPFDALYGFRPGMGVSPAIREPHGSITYDVSPCWDGSGVAGWARETVNFAVMGRLLESSAPTLQLLCSIGSILLTDSGHIEVQRSALQRCWVGSLPSQTVTTTPSSRRTCALVPSVIPRSQVSVSSATCWSNDCTRFWTRYFLDLNESVDDTGLNRGRGQLAGVPLLRPEGS